MTIGFLAQMKIRHKLAVGFSVVLLFLGAIVLINLSMVRSMSGQAREVHQLTLARTLLLHDLETHVKEIILLHEADINAETHTNEANRREHDRRIREQFAAAGDLLGREGGAAGELAAVQALYEDWHDSGEKLLELVIYQEYIPAQEVRKKNLSLRNEVTGGIDLLAEKSVDTLAGAMEHIQSTGERMQRMSLFLGLTALALGGVILYFLNRALMKPVSDLSGIMASAERGDFTVLYDNGNLIRCREALNCDKKECSAFDAANLRCWQISGTHCRGEVQGDMAQKLGSCEQCEVYLRALGDEFSTIGESLNNMLAGLSNAYAEFRAATGAILKTGSKLGEIAGGIKDGNLSQVKAIEEASSSIDEMNRSMKGISDMVERYLASAENSSSAISEMSASIAQVAQSAERLSSVGDRTTAAIEQLFTSVRNTATSVDSLSDDVSEISGAITEMGSSVSESEQTARNVAALSEEVSQKVLKGSKEAVSRAIGGMEKINAAVREADGIISDLGHKSQDIGSILEVIQDVSEQTNLLALNAAIIAAQAGEHGRGFSVVAEEVRELSERTASSAKEIGSLVATIQNGVGLAVGAMQKGGRSSEEGMALIADVDDSLRQVEDAAIKSTESSQFIVRLTTEQSKATKQIAQSSVNISHKARTIADTAKEQASTCDELAQAVSEINVMMEEVKRTTEEQSRTARQISSTAASSTETVESIDRATKEQARESAAVVGAMSSVRDVAESYGHVVSSLNEMVVSLRERASALDLEINKVKVDVDAIQGGNGDRAVAADKA